MIDDTGNFGIYFLDIPYFHSRQKNFINRFSRSREIEKYVDTRGDVFVSKSLFERRRSVKGKKKKNEKRKKEIRDCIMRVFIAFSLTLEGLLSACSYYIYRLANTRITTYLA